MRLIIALLIRSTLLILLSTRAVNSEQIAHPLDPAFAPLKNLDGMTRLELDVDGTSGASGIPKVRITFVNLSSLTFWLEKRDAWLMNGIIVTGPTGEVLRSQTQPRCLATPGVHTMLGDVQVPAHSQYVFDENMNGGFVPLTCWAFAKLPPGHYEIVATSPFILNATDENAHEFRGRYYPQHWEADRKEFDVQPVGSQ